MYVDRRHYFNHKSTLLMANFMDLLQGQLQNGLLDKLSDQMGGGATSEQTQSATNLAMSTLLGTLTKNASKPQGLQGLFGALDNHDGSILDNLGGLLGGTAQGKQADGMGILSHLLDGSNIFNVINMISKGSGLSRNNSMNLLMKLAPVALGLLGKQKKQQQMQPQGLMEYLNTSQQQVRQKAPQQDLITRILDKDGDGSAMDEIAGMGMKVLGNLFR
jgi:hypothetical protein